MADQKDSKAGGKRAIVAGATGAIGKEVVTFLLQREEVGHVTVLVRRAKCFDANPKLTEQIVDYDQKLNADDFKGSELVFCCLGSTIKKAGSQEAFRKVDIDAILAVANAAKTAGARHFALVSSVGADHTSGNFYLRTKGEAEQSIKALGFETFAYYRPSVLEADRAESRCGENVGVCCAKWVCCCCLDWCCSAYSVINVRTVALAMVKTALHGTKTGNLLFDGSGSIEAVVKAKAQ